MTALNRNNIPASITSLEGLAAWAIATYTAAYGGKVYQERDATDTQRYSRFSISPVASEENGTSLFMIARVAVPVNKQLLASTKVVWEDVIQHKETVSLPPGYTV